MMIRDVKGPLLYFYEQPRTQPRRATLDQSFLEVFTAMTEKNPGAVNCLIKLYDLDPKRMVLKYLYVLDDFEIYGSKIYMLYNDCCNRDIVSLADLLDAFAAGFYTKAEIHENLDRPRAIPFQPRGGDASNATTD